MRLNLNCRKADIKKIDIGKYRLVFDISKIKKPRLATTARLYIEHLNLPEFVDDAWGGTLGSNRGHLELFCENLEEENIDEDGYGNQTLIYSSPLISFHSFSNSDPMKISNFAVRGDFLRDKLVMTLCIYDQYGDPYDKATNLSTELDKTNAVYTDYVAKLNAWQLKNSNLETKVSAKERRIETLRTEYDALKTTSDDLEAEYNEAYANLLEELDERILATTSDLHRAKFTTFKEQLEKCSIDDEWDEISFLLTHIAKTATPPFDAASLQPILKKYTDTFYAYTKAYLITEAKNNDINLYNTATSKVMINPIITLSNPNLLDVKRVKDFKVPFAIPDPTSTATPPANLATGHIILNIFMSKKGKEIRAILNEIQGTTSAVAIGSKLLQIPVASIFKFYHPEEFRWVIGKNGTGANGTDVITRVSGGKFANFGNLRYGFTIIREKGNNSWKVEELPTQNNIDFNVGDVLLLKGQNFGGNVNNDITITVDAIHEPADIVYPGLATIMPNDTGTRTITITKSKLTNEYTATTVANLTKNLNIGDLLKIDGETLGGKSGTHDFVEEVVAVSQATREQDFDIPKLIDDPATAGLKIQNPDFEHRINSFQISDNASFAGKVVISDYAGSVKNDRKDYVITISSLNGVYTFSVNEPGTGFEEHDIIRIDGTVFNGKSGNTPATSTDSAENDLALIVTNAGLAGQLLALEAYDSTAPTNVSYSKVFSNPEKLYYARCPDEFKLKVETRIEDDAYYIDTEQFEYEPMDQVKQQDTFKIKGSLLKDFSKFPNNTAPYAHPPATDITNDLTFRIVELNPDEDRRQSLASTVGIADTTTLVRESNNSAITITITPNKAPKEAGPVGRLLLTTVTQKTAAPQEDIGRIKSFTVAGNSQITDSDKIQYETGTDQSALFPTIEFELTEILVSSINTNNTAVATAHTEMLDAKKLVQNTNSTSVSEINTDKLRNLNMSLVLYDEIPEYTQASKDAIVGNTYSRIMNNQFKRI